MPRELSLAVVGAIHPNADGSNRLFEIALMAPGDPVHLRPEPTNKADPSAVAVLSARGIQIGYLSAERCGWIGGKIKQGADVVAIFQAKTRGGAVIRANLDGDPPTLPVGKTPASIQSHADEAGADDGFWPDTIPPDD